MILIFCKQWTAVSLWRSAAFAGAWLFVLAAAAPGQVIITEIMANPSGDEDDWEWIEIRNTGAAAVNLNGWVLGDRASSYLAANISASLGNTMVPAGGVAVVYPSSTLGASAAQRFANAWGNGVTLIPTSAFPTLNNSGGERIGLWNSHTSYFVSTDAEPNWSQAVFNLDIATANGFPGVSGAGGASIYWTGSGSVTVGDNWEVSEAGAHGGRKSNPTTLPPTQVNSNLDRGNPGVLPVGQPPGGLRITEIMYNPASPAVSQGFSEADFEWVEIVNNTGSFINFSNTKYVFDDHAGGDLTAANVASGILNSGDVGVLFNSAELTVAEMRAAWGNGINFIPVSNWPGLNNSNGDTIALWSSLSAYQGETTTSAGRTHNLASTAVTYDNSAAENWPTDDGRSSIYWNSFSTNQAQGGSWARAGAAGGNVSSFTALPITRQVADNPGQDFGSPGFVPGSTVNLAGDYNGDRVVNAADYSVWRNNLGKSIHLPGEAMPRILTRADYAVWVANYGRTSGTGAAVPEPATIWFAVMALVMSCMARPFRSGCLRCASRGA